MNIYVEYKNKNIDGLKSSLQEIVENPNVSLFLSIIDCFYSYDHELHKNIADAFLHDHSYENRALLLISTLSQLFHISNNRTNYSDKQKNKINSIILSTHGLSSQLSNSDKWKWFCKIIEIYFYTLKGEDLQADWINIVNNQIPSEWKSSLHVSILYNMIYIGCDEEDVERNLSHMDDDSEIKEFTLALLWTQKYKLSDFEQILDLDKLKIYLDGDKENSWFFKTGFKKHIITEYQQRMYIVKPKFWTTVIKEGMSIGMPCIYHEVAESTEDPELKNMALFKNAHRYYWKSLISLDILNDEKISSLMLEMINYQYAYGLYYLYNREIDKDKKFAYLHDVIAQGYGPALTEAAKNLYEGKWTYNDELKIFIDTPSNEKNYDLIFEILEDAISDNDLTAAVYLLKWFEAYIENETYYEIANESLLSSDIIHIVLMKTMKEKNYGEYLKWFEKAKIFNLSFSTEFIYFQGLSLINTNDSSGWSKIEQAALDNYEDAVLMLADKNNIYVKKDDLPEEISLIGRIKKIIGVK